MKCQAVTTLNDGTVCPCTQTLMADNGLCYYHKKMRDGTIAPRNSRKENGSGSPVFKVEVGRDLIYSVTGRHTASQTSSGSTKHND